MDIVLVLVLVGAGGGLAGIGEAMGRMTRGALELFEFDRGLNG